MLGGLCGVALHRSCPVRDVYSYPGILSRVERLSDSLVTAHQYAVERDAFPRADGGEQLQSARAMQPRRRAKDKTELRVPGRGGNGSAQLEV